MCSVTWKARSIEKNVYKLKRKKKQCKDKLQDYRRRAFNLFSNSDVRLLIQWKGSTMTNWYIDSSRTLRIWFFFFTLHSRIFLVPVFGALPEGKREILSHGLSLWTYVKLEHTQIWYSLVEKYSHGWLMKGERKAAIRMEPVHSNCRYSEKMRLKMILWISKLHIFSVSRRGWQFQFPLIISWNIYVERVLRSLIKTLCLLPRIHVIKGKYPPDNFPTNFNLSSVTWRRKFTSCTQFGWISFIILNHEGCNL